MLLQPGLTRGYRPPRDTVPLTQCSRQASGRNEEKEMRWELFSTPNAQLPGHVQSFGSLYPRVAFSNIFLLFKTYIFQSSKELVSEHKPLEGRYFCVTAFITHKCYLIRLILVGEQPFLLGREFQEQELCASGRKFSITSMEGHKWVCFQHNPAKEILSNSTEFGVPSRGQREYFNFRTQLICLGRLENVNHGCSLCLLCLDASKVL